MYRVKMILTSLIGLGPDNLSYIRIYTVERQKNTGKGMISKNILCMVPTEIQKTQFHDFSMIFHDQRCNFHDYLIHGHQPLILAASSPHSINVECNNKNNMHIDHACILK